MRRMIHTVLAASAFTATLPALAHDHATGVVRERMEMMENMAKRMKAIRARIDGKRDLGEIKLDAEAIAAHAAHTVHLFPPGSTQRPTDAKAAIWQNRADFRRKAIALETESNRLANIGATDHESFTSQFRAVSQTCAACHETYRIKK